MLTRIFESLFVVLVKYDFKPLPVAKTGFVVSYFSLPIGNRVFWVGTPVTVYAA